VFSNGEQYIFQIHSIKFNVSLVLMYYLGKKSVRNQDCIHEEVNNILKSGNACSHSVQNLLFSRFLFKSIKTNSRYIKQ
jgi:hypothetical protein